MSEQYSDDLHKYDLKLRCLLTDGCNLNCSYCLNDFQPKPSSNKYIVKKYLYDRISEYRSLCKLNNIKDEIYFSGGEPTRHPNFFEFVEDVGSLNCDKFCLCTNGTSPFYDYNGFTDIHISLHKPYLDMYGLVNFITDRLTESENIKTLKNKIVFNFMFDQWSNDDVVKIVNKFKSHCSFKIWADFYKADDLNYMKRFSEFTSSHEDIIHRNNFKPVNRGMLCTNCNRPCVTLKAIWLYPNNTLSVCPQKSISPNISDALVFHKAI